MTKTTTSHTLLEVLEHFWIVLDFIAYAKSSRSFVCRLLFWFDTLNPLKSYKNRQKQRRPAKINWMLHIVKKNTFYLQTKREKNAKEREKKIQFKDCKQPKSHSTHRNPMIFRINWNSFRLRHINAACISTIVSTLKHKFNQRIGLKLK